MSVSTRDRDRTVGPTASSSEVPQGVAARFAQELECQLDATVAFADYCAFLTGYRRRGQAAQLAALAQALYDATLADLRRAGGS